MARSAPAPSPAPDEAARRAKRSATVSLVLLVGAGTAALTLGRHDPSQREEDALLYVNDGECIAQGVRPAEECVAEYRSALGQYAATAPRYETSEDCERHHGAGGCTMAQAPTAGGAAAFVPLMAGYLIGRSAAQGLPTQPLYRHAREEEGYGGGGGGGGGYCTGAGGRVYATGGGTGARVSSSVARTTTSTPRTIARGGFGGTGRATAFSSSGRSGGFGG